MRKPSQTTMPRTARRGVTVPDLERAARRFVGDVDGMLARCDDYTKPIVAYLAVMMIGRHMDRIMVKRVVAGVREMGGVPSRRRRTAA
jgi:hypothetical protein